MLSVDALQRQGEAVGVAFAADLAVGDDVDAGALHVADRQDRAVVLRRFQQLRGNAPDVLRMGARHAVLLQRRAVHQPVGLRIAAHHRGRQQMRWIGHGEPSSRRTDGCGICRRKRYSALARHDEARGPAWPTWPRLPRSGEGWGGLAEAPPLPALPAKRGRGGSLGVTFGWRVCAGRARTCGNLRHPENTSARSNERNGSQNSPA